MGGMYIACFYRLWSGTFWYFSGILWIRTVYGRIGSTCRSRKYRCFCYSDVQWQHGKTDNLDARFRIDSALLYSFLCALSGRCYQRFRFTTWRIQTESRCFRCRTLDGKYASWDRRKVGNQSIRYLWIEWDCRTGCRVRVRMSARDSLEWRPLLPGNHRPEYIATGGIRSNGRTGIHSFNQRGYAVASLPYAWFDGFASW